MALLLNRKYGSRLECLYYILKSCYAKYGTNKLFKLKDLKYDEEDNYNVHFYCKLLTNIIGRKCCPYLINPLNDSKCYATQSVISDSTKSKAVSDVGGSLEALGFIKRKGKSYIISETGEKWVNSDFYSSEWEELAFDGVLSYGVAIGFLHKIKDLSDTFSYSGLYLSYPKTEENVPYQDSSGNISYINLSTDSQKDSNTRTMSRIVGWCVSVGLIEPIGVAVNDSPLAHIKFQEFINSGELVVRTFKKTDKFKSLIGKKHYVSNPLSYSRLHKNVASLRERGGEDLRTITLKYNTKILNRRFVFVYLLNKYSENNKAINFNKLIALMDKYHDDFFADSNGASIIMESESDIADIAGIPFEVTSNNEIVPLTIINNEILIEDAPNYSIDLAKKILREMEY